MKQTTRKLVYRDHINNHLVEIFDKGDERSLYFAGNILQSSMSLSTPHKLVLSYTQYMMASLLFNNYPTNVLMVGVGAGSLLRFLNHHFPQCSVDAIDNSGHIIKLATDYFNLPTSKNINVHCCDGFDFLSKDNTPLYDLILVDAFDQNGMSPTIYCSDFFMRCCTRLKQDGLVSLNVWSGDEAKMALVKTELKQYFNSILNLPVPNRGNVICLAGRDRNLTNMMERDYVELTRLHATMQINFKKIIKVCTRYNLGFRQRISKLFS